MSFFAKLNEDNFYKNYLSRRDLQLSSFEFFHLKPLRCSKKINDLFRRQWHRGHKKVKAVTLKTTEPF